MKHANASYYLAAGGILILCFLTIWRVSNSNGQLERKLDETLKELRAIKTRLHYSSAGPGITIEGRLQEADANWRRGLEARKTLESKNLLNFENPWSFDKGVSVWDFFYPTFDCPHTVERIGKSGDGGKWICGFSHLARKEEPCIVYSYGVSSDTSFEDEVVARTNCSVYLFDHTIDIKKVKLPKLHPERVFIEKVGLGVSDTKKLRSILSTMKKYGHQFIDILKIDVESAEFAVFDNFKKDFPEALPFGQISIEIHLPVETKRQPFEKSKTWLTNLEDMGLRPFRNEFNLIAIKRSSNHYPNLCEFSLINVKYDNYLLH